MSRLRTAVPALVGVIAMTAGCASSASPRVEVVKSSLAATQGASVSSSRSSSSSQGPQSRTTTIAAHPCGFAAKPPTTYKHVLWLWLENHSYHRAVGRMPYMDTMAGRCGLARNYHSISHPSLPNYLAATSGSTQGLSRDCEPAKCSTSARSIFHQVAKNAGPWKGYAESMSGRCSHTSYGEYAARHNPAVYYRDVASSCQRRDVPLSSPTVGLRHDLAANTLPAFAFITPNLCHDSHDCSVSVADNWLSQWLPRIFNSAAWRNGRTALFVTFDEGEGGGCAPATNADDSCHVATWVFGPAVRPGTRVDLHFTHYSLLRTTEQMLNLPRFLGNAARARSMRRSFRL